MLSRKFASQVLGWTLVAAATLTLLQIILTGILIARHTHAPRDNEHPTAAQLASLNAFYPEYTLCREGAPCDVPPHIDAAVVSDAIRALSQAVCSGGRGNVTQDGSRTCACEEGFTGPWCGARVDGSCQPGQGVLEAGGTACACRNAWYGPQCTQCPVGYSADPACRTCALCESVGAQALCNGHTCIEASGTACTQVQCACPEGATGPSCTGCATPFHRNAPTCNVCTLCDGNPCRNGGTCSTVSPCTSPHHFQCNCTASWSGRRCERCDWPFALDPSTGACAACATESASPLCAGRGTLVRSGPACAAQHCVCNAPFAGANCTQCASASAIGIDCVTLDPAQCRASAGDRPTVDALGRATCACGPGRVNTLPTACAACRCVHAVLPGCVAGSGACAAPCKPGWSGPLCDTPSKCSPAHGTPAPDTGGDTCVPGTCIGGRSGALCATPSTCVHGVPALPPAGVADTAMTVARACDLQVAGCTCTGPHACWWGPNCDQPTQCNPTYGIPSTRTPWCTRCKRGWQGPACALQSTCVHGVPRGANDTSAATGCDPAHACTCTGPGNCWFGPNCDQPAQCTAGQVDATPTGTGTCDPASCPHGTWGPHCEPCACDPARGVCDVHTGHCTQCVDPWAWGPDCSKSCAGCRSASSPHIVCVNSPADPAAGTCVIGTQCTALLGQPFRWSCAQAAQVLPAAAHLTNSSECVRCVKPAGDNAQPLLALYPQCLGTQKPATFANGTAVGCTGTRCAPGWFGDHCSERCSCVHGKCANTVAHSRGVCDPGSCLPGWRGPLCNQPRCRGPGAIVADPATGLCTHCLPGWHGPLCEACSLLGKSAPARCAVPLVTMHPSYAPAIHLAQGAFLDAHNTSLNHTTIFAAYDPDPAAVPNSNFLSQKRADALAPAIAVLQNTNVAARAPRDAVWATVAGPLHITPTTPFELAPCVATDCMRCIVIFAPAQLQQQNVTLSTHRSCSGDPSPIDGSTQIGGPLV